MFVCHGDFKKRGKAVDVVYVYFGNFSNTLQVWLITCKKKKDEKKRTDSTKFFSDLQEESMTYMLHQHT